VVICSQSQQSVETAISEMQAANLQVSGLVCDVSREDQIADTVATVLGTHGRIDTLINVAGVNRRKRAETVTVEDYDFILDTNLRAHF
jgi:NAD(P)-dependent dehydrogenase (short-subunit alcohol dehydrogenase family)